VEPLHGIALVLTLMLVVYLFVALFDPERFD
jgi:K+-transporting ATPase KdpF subunit